MEALLTLCLDFFVSRSKHSSRMYEVRAPIGSRFPFLSGFPQASTSLNRLAVTRPDVRIFEFIGCIGGVAAGRFVAHALRHLFRGPDKVGATSGVNSRYFATFILGLTGFGVTALITSSITAFPIDVK